MAQSATCKLLAQRVNAAHTKDRRHLQARRRKVRTEASLEAGFDDLLSQLVGGFPLVMNHEHAGRIASRNVQNLTLSHLSQSAARQRRVSL